MKKLFFRMLLVVVGCISLKICCFDIFEVPSGSMENEVFPQDYVYVNKLYFGARWPKNQSEVPWLNIFSTQRSESDFSTNHRLPGYSSPKRYDILVFNQPFNQSQYFLKRCIALPGDTLTIQDTLVTVNSQIVYSPGQAKFTYSVDFKKGTDYANCLAKANVDHKEDWYDRTQESQTLSLTRHQVAILLSDSAVSCVRRREGKPEHTTVLDFVVPYKGWQITLDSNNFSRYKSVIKLYEDPLFRYKAGERFAFRHNYYFMMGDNRDFSFDSRAWGVMPDYCIIGKAEFIIFSTSRKRGLRLFKKLNSY